MTTALKNIFRSEFKKANHSEGSVDNIILTISEDGNYFLDVKNYDLFADTEIPELIDVILEKQLTKLSA